MRQNTGHTSNSLSYWSYTAPVLVQGRSDTNPIEENQETGTFTGVHDSPNLARREVVLPIRDGIPFGDYESP